MATNVMRPGESVLFGSNAAEERREVSWATVLLGMAAAAMLVGAISYGAARFLNGQPVQHLFQISRDESSARVEPQSAPNPDVALIEHRNRYRHRHRPRRHRRRPLSRSSRMLPSRQRHLPRASRRWLALARSSVDAENRSGRFGAGHRQCHRSAGPKPPAVAVARGNTARETEKPRAIATKRAPDRCHHRGPPLSGGRLMLPPPAPTVAPVPPPVRPFELPGHRGYEWLATGTSACSPRSSGHRCPCAGAGIVISRIARCSAAPHPVPAPSARTSAESRAEDTASIRVLLARYEAAYNRLDARAASAVWPRRK